MSESFAVLEQWWQGQVWFQEWHGGRRSASLFQM